MVVVADLEELADCVDDLRVTDHESVPNQLARLVAVTERPPLRLLLDSVLPDVDLAPWLESVSKSMRGRASLEWSVDRNQRVAHQLAVCRAIALREVRFLNFTYPFYKGTGNFDERVHWFVQVVVEPLVRDITRISQLRTTPPVVEDLLKTLPLSGDGHLDLMLLAARDKFQDKSPAIRKDALEKLWDVWERLKTLLDDDKRKGSSLLFSSASSDPDFRRLLDAEGNSLTDIGNKFKIRHFEKGTKPITSDLHVDYLFHRMFALVWLLLKAKVDGERSVAERHASDPQRDHNR